MKQTRNTQQRQLVFRLLDQHRTHPTAEQVFLMAREQSVNISRGTVYRNLNILCEQGDVRRIVVPSCPDHFDANTQRHYHFLCRNCHRVFDSSLPYDDKLDSIGAADGCVTEWHKLIFVGLCSCCSKQSQTSEKQS